MGIEVEHGLADSLGLVTLGLYFGVYAWISMQLVNALAVD